jgi:hypothetical protein
VNIHPLKRRGSIAEQLEGKLRSLHHHHRALLGGLTVTDERLRRAAMALTDMLMQPAGVTYEREIHILALFPEREEAAFWGTPVGRALAWLGSQAENPDDNDPVPQAGAALALGVVKQRASQMVKEGKLLPHPQVGGHGVTRASLSAQMRERFPLG